MDPTTRCWSSDLGKLILRLTIGGLLLFHGIDKIMHKEHIDMITNQVKANNMPEFVGYGVYIGEVLGPILVLVGFWTRLGALVIAINMAVAVALVHREQLGVLNQGGGYQLELQAMYFFGALAIVFLGAGRLSISGARRAVVETTPTATSPPPRQPVR